MKKWLFNSCNEEGISNFDAIVGIFTVLSAFMIPIALKLIFG